MPTLQNTLNADENAHHDYDHHDHDDDAHDETPAPLLTED